jgi:hypothetical protein
MSLDDSYDTDQEYVPLQEAVSDDQVPLMHLIQLATPSGTEPGATIGLSPDAVQIAQGPVEPYQHLESRGNGLNTHNLNSTFADRLSRAILDAEAQTGERAVLRDLYRPPERQAQYYANYTQRPITFGGVTYQPGERGGLAAPPGQSRHGQGQAADIQRGAVLDYLHSNADKYGLEFLKGASYARDPVHIQLSGSGNGNRPNLPASVSMDATARELEALSQTPARQPLRLTVTPREGTGIAAGGEGPLPYDVQPVPEPDQRDESQRLDELLNEVQALQQPDKRAAQQFQQVTQQPSINELQALSLPVPEPQPAGQPNYGIPVVSQTPLIVTGADGQPQTISAEAALQNPAIGMTKGAGLAPELLQQVQQGTAPVYSGEDIASMTHGPAGPSTYIQPHGFTERAAVGVAGIPYAITKMPYNMVKGAHDLYQSAMQTPPGQLEVDPEQAGAGFFQGLGMTGVRFPFVKPGELGATGGGRLGPIGQRPPSPAAMPPTQPPPAAGHNMPPGPVPPVTPNATAPTAMRPSVIDYLRTGDDQSAGFIRFANRAGAHPQAINELRDSFRVNTGAASQTFAEGAATLGRAELPGMAFSVPHALPELRPLIQASRLGSEGFSKYMFALDTADEINMAYNAMTQRQRAALPGPITVRGLDLQTAQNVARAYEAADPSLLQMRQVYRENMMELARFRGDGEYATMTPKEVADFNSMNPNYVPWRAPVSGSTRVKASNRSDANNIAVRGDPIDQALYDITYGTRGRLNNEAKGLGVDTILRTPNGQRILRRVTPEELSQNADWRRRSVDFKRRGETEHYVAESQIVADWLKMDPYGRMGMLGDITNTGRNWFQFYTTGPGNPAFPPIDMLRNLWISQASVTALGKGYRNPTAFNIIGALRGKDVAFGPGSLPYAYASQLIPELANGMSKGLETAAGGFLGRAFGRQNLLGLSDALAHAYTNSLRFRVQGMGGYAGSRGKNLAEDVWSANNRIDQYLKSAAGNTIPGRLAGRVFKAYMAHQDMIHDNTNFAFMQRRGNLQRAGSLQELAMDARDLTGNPRTAGRYTTPTGKPIRFDVGPASQGSLTQMGRRIAAPIAETYLAANELGRAGVPWYNMTQQGIKNQASGLLPYPGLRRGLREQGAAYLKNPAEFIGRSWLLHMMPIAGLYFYASSLGKDPNGTSYVDHMMNRRDPGRQGMYAYIPLPGRAAEDGIELPVHQEGVFFKMMMEAFLHHTYGDQKFVNQSMMQDFQSAATTFLDVAIMPPMNPIISAAFAAAGQSPPANFGYFLPGGMLGNLSGIGGEVYTRKQSPYDQNAAMPSTLEGTVRAIAPTIADYIGKGYAAYTHTNQEMDSAVKNGFKEAGRAIIKRTPIMRDIADMHSNISGNTLASRQAFERDKEINQLASFWKQYGATGKERITKDRPSSKSGDAAATAAVGEHMPPESMGLDQPPPTNPLYLQFMQQVYNATKHDSDRTGGSGYRSIWDRYRETTKDIAAMRNIDYGNMVTWQQSMDARPTTLDYLKRNNIDPHNPYAVRNFIERKRQNILKEINTKINQVESTIGYKLKDLHPYHLPGATPVAEDIAPWNTPL